MLDVKANKFISMSRFSEMWMRKISSKLSICAEAGWLFIDFSCFSPPWHIPSSGYL